MPSESSRETTGKLGQSWTNGCAAISEAGRIRGREWAEESARADQLQRLEQLRDDWLKLSGGQSGEALDWSEYEDLEEDVCGDDAELISLFDEQTFRAAFLEAAVKAWHAVHD
jgi:hypothetical protein